MLREERDRRDMKMSLEWFYLPLLVMSTATLAQDVNWGFKVRCFVVHGEVICPGCNTRAGLSCPRVNPPVRACENENEFWQLPPKTKKPTTIDAETTTSVTTETETETTTSEVTTGQNIFDNHIGDVPATTPWDLELFLYQIISEPPKRRTKRDDNSCRWNGDCPCPLICCRTSEDCEKKCMMGVRLPPPWGTG
ncbi:uncharacterized protein [Parasteatoda tepidariorum]|uniref:uncharacterized protein n=1 Tax=Parasteatoda tepidariorum TaxID=114398 RepID=UPI00077FCE74|nr:uncharacterized protein LOC107457264 [Parasteatoda tepidariorum]